MAKFKHIKKLAKGKYQAQSLRTYGTLRISGSPRSWMMKIHHDGDWMDLDYFYPSPYIFRNLEEVDAHVARIHHRIEAGKLLAYRDRVKEIADMRSRRHELITLMPIHIQELFADVRFEDLRDPNFTRGSSDRGLITIREENDRYAVTVELKKHHLDEDYEWMKMAED